MKGQWGKQAVIQLKFYAHPLLKHLKRRRFSIITISTDTGKADGRQGFKIQSLVVLKDLGLREDKDLVVSLFLRWNNDQQIGIEQSVDTFFRQALTATRDTHMMAWEVVLVHASGSYLFPWPKPVYWLTPAMFCWLTNASSSSLSCNKYLIYSPALRRFR